MKLESQEAELLLHIQQEVLRSVVISLGCLNAPAMPTVAIALRAAGSDGRCGATASQMLVDLADTVDAFASKAGALKH